jgi:hypothetical protein
MNDYIFLMHSDSGPTSPKEWDAYIGRLNGLGVFQGGSSIGDGVCVSKSGETNAITGHLSGYIKIKAATLDEAKQFVDGNPAFEAGGTVEIRELPRS